jgi:hypothetical protein
VQHKSRNIGESRETLKQRSIERKHRAASDAVRIEKVNAEASELIKADEENLRKTSLNEENKQIIVQKIKDTINCRSLHATCSKFKFFHR